jgi:hypothetical protein
MEELLLVSMPEGSTKEKDIDIRGTKTGLQLFFLSLSIHHYTQQKAFVTSERTTTLRSYHRIHAH